MDADASQLVLKNEVPLRKLTLVPCFDLNGKITSKPTIDSYHRKTTDAGISDRFRASQLYYKKAASRGSRRVAYIPKQNLSCDIQTNQ